MTTIAGVIAELDDIVDHAIQTRDRSGYFAAMYRRVTVAVRDAIEADMFDDGPRMEELDVVFANRFIDAWKHHQADRTPTESWMLAFRAARRSKPIIVQHLLVGMNAHINLDLGVAAATVAPGAAIKDLKDDFYRINDVLSRMVGGFVTDVGDLSPWIALVDKVSGGGEDVLIRFSVEVARDEAWAFAQELAALPGDRRVDAADWNDAINRRDRVVEVLGRGILSPGPIIGAAIWLARQRESNKVERVIRHLG